jgi:hypothetical protein
LKITKSWRRLLSTICYIRCNTGQQRDITSNKGRCTTLQGIASTFRWLSAGCRFRGAGAGVSEKRCHRILRAYKSITPQI